jgi:cyclopropane fatty-acyl-phospholipid synthase-like methyltransferase
LSNNFYRLLLDGHMAYSGAYFTREDLSLHDAQTAKLEMNCQFVALVGAELVRVWRLYLAGGRLAFEEGRMGVDQVLAIKPTDGITGTRVT